MRKESRRYLFPGDRVKSALSTYILRHAGSWKGPMHGSAQSSNNLVSWDFSGLRVFMITSSLALDLQDSLTVECSVFY